MANPFRIDLKIPQKHRNSYYCNLPRIFIVPLTVPLPPTDLQLEFFDKLVLTLEGPYFQDTEFTVDMPGIEAMWQDPKHGVCECYLAVITPDDGYQAIPGEKDEVFTSFFNYVAFLSKRSV